MKCIGHLSSLRWCFRQSHWTYGIYVKRICTEVTVVQHEDYPKTCITEDTVKVGKLDVTHLEKSSVDAKAVEERIEAYRDRVDGNRKV